VNLSVSPLCRVWAEVSRAAGGFNLEPANGQVGDAIGTRSAEPS
jgi:hypothetical protein